MTKILMMNLKQSQKITFYEKILVSSKIIGDDPRTPLSMMKSGIVVKNITEQHSVSSHITRATVPAHL
jgi:hypothetical protein